MSHNDSDLLTGYKVFLVEYAGSVKINNLQISCIMIFINYHCKDMKLIITSSGWGTTMSLVVTSSGLHEKDKDPSH